MGWAVAPRKLLGYLLSDATPEAAGKRRFFTGIGYSTAQPELLEAALLQHPATAPLEYEDTSSPYGPKRVHRCSLPTAPNGKAYCVRTVWQLRGATWHFLTAYPQAQS